MRYEDFVVKKHENHVKELICEFYVEPRGKIKRAAGAIAAESSIGTWTQLMTEKRYMLHLAAKVFSIKKFGKGYTVKIAYPLELFEFINIPNILSSVAGNIFGMKEIKNLRLNNIIFPKKLLKAYKGPKFGIGGIRKLLKIKKRPLLGTIIKPKLGLNAKDHAKVAYEAWLGGCDIVKDDENLASQSFNKFEERLKETLKLKEKAEKKTGEKKVYMINVTAETKEMLRRAEKVRQVGNEYLMVDIITVGWSALQTLRNYNEKLNLVMHAHRAMHAAFTKGKHGISMKVICKLVRLIGLDQLHVGTGIGKMFEPKQEVRENIEVCKEEKEFQGFKKIFPVCSGGLHPGHVPFLLKNYGNDIIIQMGGGIHGHSLGSLAGAIAARQAIEACMQNLSLEEYAKKHLELREALRKWK